MLAEMVVVAVERWVINHDDAGEDDACTLKAG